MKKKNLPAFFVLAVFLLLVDQGTKALAVYALKGKAAFSLIPGVLEFYYLQNVGAAFGILKQKQMLFIILALVITAGAFYAAWKTPDGRHFCLLRILCILLACGAMGNMLDRIFRGYVVDFIYISLIDFPVFNLADCYVCVSVVLLCISLFTIYKEEDLPFFGR